MKKKLTAVALVVCMLAIMLVGASLAYFTDKTDTAKNTFTVGNVDIDLTEPNWASTGAQDAPEVYPGEKLAKDPTVTNTGANPCFVRIKVTGLDCLATSCGQATGDATLITVEGLSNDWTLHTDGYYYYNKVLPVDDAATTEVNEGKTPACFTGIRMPTALINGNPTTEFSVNVYAEAVQAQGARPSWDVEDTTDPRYPGVKQMTVQQIADWFNTCGMNDSSK